MQIIWLISRNGLPKKGKKLIRQTTGNEIRTRQAFLSSSFFFLISFEYFLINVVNHVSTHVHHLLFCLRSVLNIQFYFRINSYERIKTGLIVLGNGKISRKTLDDDDDDVYRRVVRQQAERIVISIIYMINLNI